MPLATKAQTSSLNVLPFEAGYELFRQGSKYGEGKRQLQSLGDGQFSIELKSHLEWLIFSDDRHELSKFKMGPEIIQPIEYKYVRKGTGKDKKLRATFNSDGSLDVKPLPKKQPETTWQLGTMDELTLHLQVQQDLIAGKEKFSYNIISSGGKLRKYNMEVIGQEIISTSLGRFNAIKVARIYETNKHTSLHAWFVPELNHTLARLWRIKKGVEQYDLVIKSYKQN